MDDKCRYCGSENVVPVLDERLKKSDAAGNPYRAACLQKTCRRWNTFPKKSEFRNHPTPHVLPADADPDDVEALVPLEDFDGDPELEELQEQLRSRSGGQQQAMTDGGESADDDVVEEEPVNRFECPYTGCETMVEGQPDECPNPDCKGAYNW